MSKQQIVDRLGKIKEKCAHILFKDHEQNFQDRKQARLINSTRTKLGLVSKDLIMSSLLSSPKYNQWKKSRYYQLVLKH